MQGQINNRSDDLEIIVRSLVIDALSDTEGKSAPGVEELLESFDASLAAKDGNI